MTMPPAPHTGPCTCLACRERAEAWKARCADPAGEAGRAYFEEVIPRWRRECPAAPKERKHATP